jgi:hypothetical protein
MDDHDSDSSFENPYHNPVLGREKCGREYQYGHLGFKVDYKEVPDRMKVKLVAIKLKSHASSWWEQLKRSQDRQCKPKICDWEKMKGHFLPFRYTHT